MERKWQEFHHLGSRRVLQRFPTFVTRLKDFAFKKVESEHWEYANEDFVRGKPELTFDIQKRYKESLGPTTFEFKAEPGALETRRAYIKAMMQQRRALANLTL
ncbi:Heat stress transcription factor A-4a [Cardamine amara subsp. amara]|uniref:Heat stress transcription factor A-4a n=1 Tax=Cardamine amara subsp. amara TaxID=228776 RepID=A0ABD1AUG0_CARAN